MLICLTFWLFNVTHCQFGFVSWYFTCKFSVLGWSVLAEYMASFWPVNIFKPTRVRSSFAPYFN